MNKEILKTITIVILIGAITWFFGNQWFQGRLTQERNNTVLQVQNEIYKLVKTTGTIKINAFEAGEDGEIQIIDNIILVESNAD